MRYYKKATGQHVEDYEYLCYERSDTCPASCAALDIELWWPL